MNRLREEKKFPLELKNCLSIYSYNGKRYAEAFMLFRFFSKRFIFWKHREEIP